MKGILLLLMTLKKTKMDVLLKESIYNMHDDMTSSRIIVCFLISYFSPVG